ncbi:MAG: hypothetical protein Ct9H300mP14_04010 [Gammaproteobacteria bacterium]|nr:MAG: hypothetical protein Ct9H300mP14_04010 [Gammaproteobacteria bacterium]
MGLNELIFGGLAVLGIGFLCIRPVSRVVVANVNERIDSDGTPLKRQSAKKKS